MHLMCPWPVGLKKNVSISEVCMAIDIKYYEQNTDILISAT